MSSKTMDAETRTSLSHRHTLSSRVVVILSLLLFILLVVEYEVIVTYKELIQNQKLWKNLLGWAIGAFVLILWSVALWSYVTCWLTDPGGVPAYWDELVKEQGYPTSRELHQWAVGTSQYCSQCQAYRPERARHCEICGRCILRMDHHCQLLGTCIGLKNIKYFVLFWFWASLLTIAMSTSSLLLLAPKLASHNCENKTLAELEAYKKGLPVLLIGVGSGILYAILAIITFSAFVIHLLLIVRNCSSIEESYKGKNPYDNGVRENVEFIFGPPSWRWLLPVPQQAVPKSYGLAYKIGNTTSIPRLEAVLEHAAPIDNSASESVPLVIAA